MLVKIKDVSFTYEGNQRPSLIDVSLEVKRGDFVLVVGKSGSGKSTLLRLLNGLIPHFYQGEMKGKVLVDGIDTREATVAQLARKVGLVFQNPDNQIVNLKVDRELAFGLENIGLGREEIVERIREVSSLLGISNLLDKFTFELSGGQKQLVAIASAIAMKPLILALDEPTSELDPLNSAKIAGILKKLNKLGITIIVAEHRLDLFAGLSNKVVVMDEGKIVMEGNPRDVLYSSVKDFGVRPPKVVELARSFNLSGPLTVGELVVALRR